MSFSSSKALFVLGIALSGTALAQDYSGTWTARHPNGGTVTLTLEQQGGELAGRLEGAGASFDVEAEVRDGGIVGMVTGEQAMVYLTGRLSGDTLRIMLLEPGPGGRPDAQSARQINFTRGNRGQAPKSGTDHVFARSEAGR